MSRKHRSGRSYRTSRSKPRRTFRTPHSRHLRFEPLEDRRLLAIFNVSSLSDAGGGSLRDAITAANLTTDPDEIQFSVTGQIDLNSQLPTITQPLTITGPGQDLLTIDAGDGTDNAFGTGDGFRIFDIDNGSEFLQIDVTISGVTLTGGDTLTGVFPLASDGGAIRSTENLMVLDSTIDRNSTGDTPTGAGGFSGGGIFSNGGDLLIVRSTISNNETGKGPPSANGGHGGGVYATYGNLAVVDSTISGNVTGQGDTGGTFQELFRGYGGGIFSGGDFVNGSDAYTATIVNSTVSGNLAAAGGGVRNDRGLLVIEQSTITANTSTTVGTINGAAGVSSLGNSGFANTEVFGSIIAGNFGLDVALLGGGGLDNTFTSNGFNLIGTGDNLTAFNQSGDTFGVLDPGLGLLADNDGPTRTHSVQFDSPALDRGDPNFAIPLADDQRGLFPRVSGDRVDIGAYERFILLVDNNGDVNDGDFSVTQFTLREAIEAANTTFAGDDIIMFDPSLAGQIDLASQLPTIIDSLAIIGPGADHLTIDAGDGDDDTFETADGFRIFLIDNGIVGAQSDVTLKGLTLTGGDVADADQFGDGGAINNRENLTLLDSVVTENATSEGAGAGIRNDGVLTVVRSTISENDASGDGGGISSGVSSTLSVVNSTISTNFAMFFGGGISNLGFADITGSTVSGNLVIGSPNSDQGGGISNFGGTTNIAHSTITGNSGDDGGGIANVAGSVTLNSTIVAGNFVGFSSPSDISGSIATASSANNLIGDAGSAGGLTDTVDGNIVGSDPLLGLLAFNGGLTQTHALLAGSPAIDEGDPSVFFNPNESDGRGLPFVRFAGVFVDIGAVERQAVANLNLVVDTTQDENDGDYSVGDLSLREAMGLANGSVGADNITFDANVFGTPQTIDIDTLLPQVVDDLILTGPGADILTIDGGDSTRLFAISDGDLATQIDVEISGLTLTGGNGPGGGAIFNFENLTISQSTITENRAPFGGGINNVGTLNFTNSTLSNNEATYAGGFGGGGLLNIGTATITGSTISGNVSATNGGGVLNYYDGALNISSSTLSGNAASFTGGGVSNFDDANITDSTLSGNSATTGGGVYSRSEATTSVANSTLSGNTATGNGGAIATGLISTTTVSHSTLAGNTAGMNGGGISSYGTTDVTNSIVAQNTALLNPDLSGSLNTLAFNLIGGDPLIGPLGENGGPTLPNGAVIQTHALLPGSPALDAGDPNFNPGIFTPFLVNDQRGTGFDRVVNGGNSLRIDIGAYESQGIPVAFPDGDYNQDGVADAADYTVWRDTLGSSTDLRADGSGNNVIDAADYTFWKTNFGNTTVPTAPAGNAALDFPPVGDAPASIFLSPTAKTQAVDGASNLVSESRSSGTSDDGLLLLALADWDNTEPPAEAGGYLQEELSNDESIALTLEFAFSDWD